MSPRNAFSSALLFIISTALTLGVGEGILRIKYSSMSNYDIEMWRYAKELKVRSENARMAFDHVKNASAILQSVTIRTNRWGLRGPPVPSRDPNIRRILFLGGSITLGWGVKEEDTLEEQLRRKFAAAGRKVEVLNGGVGNYNAERYVERFFTKLKGLMPSDIVVQYFLRDAEHLDPGGGNYLLRHSVLAASLWIAASRLTGKWGDSLKEHYRIVYREDQLGYRKMQSALKKLADYAKKNNIRLYLAMTPDIHNLREYPFRYIHERMRRIAVAYGYTFVDLFPALATLPAERLWAMQGDPHPNALGHRLSAEALFPVLALAPPAKHTLTH